MTMKTKYPKTELGGGYAGLANTADQIAKYIPDCKIYVEPFAGLGRVGKFSNAEIRVFNDKSDFAVLQLRKKFPNSIITQIDFVECIEKWDSEDTFFLIDPPWRKPIYDMEKYFADRTPKEYYQRVMEILPNLKGNWIVCSSLAERGLNRILSKSGYPMIDIKSEKKIFDKHATVKLISNKPFIKRQNLMSLEVWQT